MPGASTLKVAFQSLVGAMRTRSSRTRRNATRHVSIPRRGNEDPIEAGHSVWVNWFQSLVGAMRTGWDLPLILPDLNSFNPS